jgi:hypothetical protein
VFYLPELVCHLWWGRTATAAKDHEEKFGIERQINNLKADAPKNEYKPTEQSTSGFWSIPSMHKSEEVTVSR